MKNIIAVFPSANIPESIAFYERMGFALQFTNGDPIDYASVKRGEAEIHFFPCDDRKIAEWTGCRIGVEDIDGLFKEFSALDIIHPNAPLADKPWGLREFAIIDNAGCLITFFTPVPVS